MAESDAQPTHPADNAAPEHISRWISGELLGVEGRGWTHTHAYYHRLPADALSLVNDTVWDLSQDTAGMALHIRTDSPELLVKWTLSKAQLAMSHMPATGVSGVDLYVNEDEGWRWLAAGRPGEGAANQATLFTGFSSKSREFLLYLPLYNGLVSLEIGITPSAQIETVRREDKPIVFYGTSITQGGCASRPGMAYPALLGRRLGREIINLGFSGSGKMEAALADLLAELDPAAYVIDCLPNLQSSEVCRVEHALSVLRVRHPAVPIVLVESISYTQGWAVESLRQRSESSNAVLREIHDRLSADDPRLFLVDGALLLGDDGEATVDGTHPTDLGFLRIASHIETTLRHALR